MGVFTTCTATVNAITSLSRYPNASDGLTYAQFQAKFDKAGSELKAYINDVFIPELQAIVAASGASKIGVYSILGIDGNDVQTVLTNLKAAIDATVLGDIPDSSLTEAKMAVEMKKDTATGVVSYSAFDTHQLKTGSSTILGHYKIGNYLQVDINGVLTPITDTATGVVLYSTFADHALKTATTTTLGHIKDGGKGLFVFEDGSVITMNNTGNYNDTSSVVESGVDKVINIPVVVDGATMGVAILNGYSDYGAMIMFTDNVADAHGISGAGPGLRVLNNGTLSNSYFDSGAPSGSIKLKSARLVADQLELVFSQTSGSDKTLVLTDCLWEVWG